MSNDVYRDGKHENNPPATNDFCTDGKVANFVYDIEAPILPHAELLILTAILEYEQASGRSEPDADSYFESVDSWSPEDYGDQKLALAAPDAPGCACHISLSVFGRHGHV